jgi:hypothetical protein
VPEKFREVLDCGSPLPPFPAGLATRKRQRAAAVQDAARQPTNPIQFIAYSFFETVLVLQLERRLSLIFHRKIPKVAGEMIGLQQNAVSMCNSQRGLPI